MTNKFKEKKLKNNKQLMILMCLSLALLITLPMMSAAVAVTSPTSGSNNTGTLTFTCTKGIGDDPLNASNASLYYALATTGTYAKLAGSTVVNDTFDDTTFSVAGLSISGLTDGVYNFTCYSANATSNVISAVVKATVDNTSPVVTISSSDSQISSKRQVTLSWTSTDATSLASTSVSIVSPDTARCATKTVTTGSSVTLVDQETMCAGYYTATVTGTDYAGNTKTASVQFRVTAPDGKFIGEKSIAPISDKQQTTRNVVVIAVIILIIALFVRKK